MNRYLRLNYVNSTQKKTIQIMDTAFFTVLVKNKNAWERLKKNFAGWFNGKKQHILVPFHAPYVHFGLRADF